MSLVTLDGEILGFPLHSGIVSVGSELSDDLGPAGLHPLAGPSCGATVDDDGLFGVPTWAFWTAVAVLLAAIVLVVALNVAHHGTSRSKVRHHHHARRGR